jgi:hypothetical protein
LWPEGYVGALISGADFAKGSRFIQGGGSADITKFRRLGNNGLNCLVNILFSTRYTDVCYGYNAFWRPCLESMRLPAVDGRTRQWGDGFEIETLINVRVAAANQLNVSEVCSYEEQRIHGVSNLNAVTDGLRVLRTIRQEYWYAKTAKRHKVPVQASQGRNGRREVRSERIRMGPITVRPPTVSILFGFNRPERV